MKKSKEEKVIDKSAVVLEELNSVYHEGLGVQEYRALLTDYKKLYKRFQKVMKVSDSIGTVIMNRNEMLSNNLQYTIKKARTKLMSNISNHRKTKESFSRHQLKGKTLENTVMKFATQKKEMEKKLELYENRFGEFDELFPSELQSNNPVTKPTVKPIGDSKQDQNQTLTLTELISRESLLYPNEFVLSKVVLKDFEAIKNNIGQSCPIENFISGVTKYLNNIFNKNEIVFYKKDKFFYIISREKDIKNVEKVMGTINSKRKVFDSPISFFVGITQFIPTKDTADTILTRCNEALYLAQKNNKDIITQ